IVASTTTSLVVRKRWTVVSASIIANLRFSRLTRTTVVLAVATPERRHRALYPPLGDPRGRAPSQPNHAQPGPRHPDRPPDASQRMLEASPIRSEAIADRVADADSVWHEEHGPEEVPREE